MSKYISLTAIGKDKPGIVSAIAEVLYDAKCNIEDSTMTILHGQFAMILILCVPENISEVFLFEKLQKSSKTLGMFISYTNIDSYSPKKYLSSNPFIISVYGADKTGLVYNVSKYLAENEINITDVQTSLSKHKDDNTYIMIIESDFPKSVSYEKISKGLADLAKSLNVIISINRAESANI
ncbi:MAG: hypothetical protein LBU51_09325 [Bacteroidales bacterium]|jgi:glycine cleavage system transcriptional repressor|nr:hypothetical protein [Bacteroidales bacterium]